VSEVRGDKVFGEKGSRKKCAIFLGGGAARGGGSGHRGEETAISRKGVRDKGVIVANVS